jgi:hypothetical protein
VGVKYVLMLCSDATVPDEVANAAIEAGCDGWSEEMARRGILRDTTGLHPPANATTLRVRDGQVLLTDGPFAETKDQIGGFAMIECADLAEALDVAARHPWAKAGQIEVRPVYQP